MAKETAIAWCDSTFNPWVGCNKVSAGCTHCYAERQSKRMKDGAGLWGPDGERRVTSPAYWKQPLKWNREAAELGKPWRVFCGSMCDVFEDRKDIENTRKALFHLIFQTPYLIWMLLTKRPENIRRFAPWINEDESLGTCPLPSNVWLGATFENQEQFDRRIGHLLATPAALHFGSFEPLLGPILPFFDVPCLQYTDQGVVGRKRLGWVIAGGESGSHARPMQPAWARSLRDQCQSAGVPYFFKQWGQHCDWIQMPADTARKVGSPTEGYTKQFYSVGVKAAGDLLDGRQWHEFPEDWRPTNAPDD